MKQQCEKIFLIFLIPFFLLASANSIQNQAFFLRHTENGLILVRQEGLSFTEDPEMPDNPLVVWSYNLTDATYNTTSNTVDGHVFAGTWLNPPKEAQLFALTGGGIPDGGA